MAIPSFDELLSRARQLGASNSQYPSTGELAAKGVSEFVTNLLGASAGEKRDVSGYLTSGGDIKALPKQYKTGGTVLESVFRKMFGGGVAPSLPTDSIPLSEAQTTDFAMKEALQTRKYDAITKIAGIRATAMQKVAGMKIKTTTQPMIKEASDYVWSLMGRDPSTETELPILTYGDADRMLRAKGIDTNTELKSIGYDISLNKDPLFGVPPAERSRIQGSLEGAGKGSAKTKAPAAPGMIRVRNKSTNQTGSLPQNEFDPNLYEKIK